MFIKMTDVSQFIFSILLFKYKFHDIKWNGFLQFGSVRLGAGQTRNSKNDIIGNQLGSHSFLITNDYKLSIYNFQSHYNKSLNHTNQQYRKHLSSINSYITKEF